MSLTEKISSVQTTFRELLATTKNQTGAGMHSEDTGTRSPHEAGVYDIRTPPLPDASSQKKMRSANDCIVNVVIMMTCFSLIEAAAVGIISLAGSLQPQLGLFMNGTLYFTFAFSLLLTPALVSGKAVGTKWSLVLGCAMYSIFVCVQIYPEWYTLIPGAVVGGMGSAIFWTAEGKYLVASAVEYASIKGSSSSISAIGLFSGICAAIYGTMIVLGQIFSSLVLMFGENANISSILFGFYGLLSILSAVVVAVTVRGIEESSLLKYEGDNCPLQDKPTTVSDTLLATLRNLRDPKTFLMVPSNITFGLISSFQNGYFVTYIVGPCLGTDNITMITAIVAGVMGLSSLPIGHMSDRFGNAPFMVLGFLATISVAVTSLIWTPEADWLVICTLAVLFGISSAVWTCINTAVMSGFFHHDPAPAICNMRLWQSLSSGISMIIFASTSNATRELIVLMTVATFGISGFAAASHIHNRQNKKLAMLSVSREVDV